MSRTTRGGSRNHTPNVRPVQRIELSERNTKQRLAAVIICLVIASAAFVYALNGLMKNDSGWTNIEVSSSADINCGEDFIFQYKIGVSGMDATAEKKALTLLYTDAAVKAYQNFQNDETFEGVTSVYDINQHPNEELTVDPILYQAFEIFAYTGRRELYLAPIYREYDNLFFCNDDAETVSFDAYQNTEVAAYFSEITAYTNDPEMVNLELLGDNRVRLFVSDDYLKFAKENYISDFIDFSWMRNAFIIDYLADVMSQNGYTLGTITSSDGFTRNLDKNSAGKAELESEEQNNGAYSFNIYDRQKQVIYPAAVMEYSGAMSIVSLHNYPMSDKEAYDYYEFKNGEIRTRYIDTKDGLCKSAVNNIVAYSEDQGCVITLFKVIPVYIADSVDPDLVSYLAGDGIGLIYGKDSTLYYNDPDLKLSELYNKDGVTYTTKLVSGK